MKSRVLGNGTKERRIRIPHPKRRRERENKRVIGAWILGEVGFIDAALRFISEVLVVRRADCFGPTLNQCGKSIRLMGTMRDTASDCTAD